MIPLFYRYQSDWYFQQNMYGVAAANLLGKDYSIVYTSWGYFVLVLRPIPQQPVHHTSFGLLLVNNFSGLFESFMNHQPLLDFLFCQRKPLRSFGLYPDTNWLLFFQPVDSVSCIAVTDFIQTRPSFSIHFVLMHQSNGQRSPTQACTAAASPGVVERLHHQASPVTTPPPSSAEELRTASSPVRTPPPLWKSLKMTPSEHRVISDKDQTAVVVVDGRPEMHSPICPVPRGDIELGIGRDSTISSAPVAVTRSPTHRPTVRPSGGLFSIDSILSSKTTSSRQTLPSSTSSPLSSPTLSGSSSSHKRHSTELESSHESPVKRTCYTPPSRRLSQSSNSPRSEVSTALRQGAGGVSVATERSPLTSPVLTPSDRPGDYLAAAASFASLPPNHPAAAHWPYHPWITASPYMHYAYEGMYKIAYYISQNIWFFLQFR